MKQAALLAAASLFVRFLGFAYRVPITNLIGDEGNAFYAIAFSVYTFALVISSAALPAAISKLVSERVAKGQYRNAHEIFRTAMIFAVIVSTFAGLVIGFGAAHIVEFFEFAEETILAIRILSPTLVVVSVLAVFRGYFQGMKTTMPTALSQVVEQIFNVVFTIWLAFLFFDVDDLRHSVAGMAAGTGIGAVAAVFVVIGLYVLVAGDYRRRIIAEINIKSANKISSADYNSGIDGSEEEQPMAQREAKKVKTILDNFESRSAQLWAIIRTASPILIGMGIFSAASFIDISMATARLDASGIFTVEEANVMIGQFTGKFVLITTLPVALSLALSSAVIPEISSSKACLDMKAIQHKTNMALRLSMAVSIPSAVGLAVLADQILLLLFPSQPDGGWLLRFGAVSIIFMALVNILTGVLQGIGKVGTPVIGAFFGLLVKISINYYLIAVPEINILGAVISTIVCYMLAAGLNIFFLYRYTGIVPSLIGAFGKPIIASAAMGMMAFGVYQIGSFILPNAVATLLAIILSALTYLVFMLLIKGFQPSDLNAIPMPAKLRRIFNSF